MCLTQDIGKTITQGVAIGITSPLSLPLGDIICKDLLKTICIEEIIAIEVNMKHRILFPFRFQRIYLQTLKQSLPTFKVALQGGEQQGFAKTAGTTQKIDFPLSGQLIHQIGLVCIDKAAIANLLKSLYTDGIFHIAESFYLPANLAQFIDNSK